MCLNGTGILNSWLRREFFPDESYKTMNSGALLTAIGAEGIICYPFGNGSERILENQNCGGQIKGLDFNRHNKYHLARAAQEAAWENELHHQPKNPEETLLHKERLAALSALVKQLPKREQEIIALKFDAELTNREIAHVLSTSEVNVRVTIFRALRKLRERMKAAGSTGA